MERLSAETIPLVTVGLPWSARALPMATTSSPTATSDDLPIVTVGRPLAPVVFSSARSALASMPTSVAVLARDWPLSVTMIELAPLTTWALVSTSPSAVRMTPLPAEVLAKGPWLLEASMLTTAGSTLATIWATSSDPPAIREADVVRTTVVGAVAAGTSARVTNPPAEPASRATASSAIASRQRPRRGGGGGAVCCGGVHEGGAPGVQGWGSATPGGSSAAVRSSGGMVGLRFPLLLPCHWDAGNGG